MGLNRVARRRVDLVQVGLADNVSAVVTDLDGAMRGSVWTSHSHLSLTEYLARPGIVCRPGTPLIRLDLSGHDFYFAHLTAGPDWLAALPRGHVQPPLGAARPHAGETWTDMPGWSLAPDVYATLAPSAGVIVQDAAEHLPSPPPRP